MSKFKRGLRIVILIFLLVLVLAGAIFMIIRQSGKNGLRENIVSENMSQGETDSYKFISYQGQEYQYRENIINILCLGIDKEEEMALRNNVDNSIGQADAIFLLSIDMDTKEIRVIAIPRDTMVTLQMYNSLGEYMGERPGQLTLQYAYADGQEMSALLTANQVSALLNNIPINGYAAINVYSLWALNAAVGGVDMTMDEDYTMFHPAFEKGATVHLTENLLENFIRGRNKGESGSAYTRIHRMKQYMLAFFESAKEALKHDVMLPVRALRTLEDNMEIDLTVAEVIYLVSEAVRYNFSEANMHTLSGEIIMGEMYEEYHLDEEALNALIVDLFYEEK